MEIVKLGNIADVKISGVDKKTKEGELPVRLCNFVDVYYNWAVTSDLYSSFMEASAKSSEIEKFSLSKGQVAITKDSETRFDIGISTYIADDLDGVILGYHCALITPNQSLLNGKYLNVLLHSKYANTYFANNATGSGQRFTISETTIKSFPIPLLPLEVQARIGDYLSDLDRKIALNQKQNDLLEQLAKQIYEYWFVQYDFPNDQGLPYKSSGGKMVYSDALKIMVPEHWIVDNIGNCISYNRGHSYTGENLSQNGLPMINMANFTPRGKYNPKGIKYYTGRLNQEKYLKPLDLVICNTQQTAIDFEKDIIGRALLVPDIFNDDIISSHHVTTIKCHVEQMKFYFYYLFNSDYFHKYISKHTNGTNILSLLTSGLEKYKTIIPDTRTLERFSELIIDIQNKISCNIKDTSNLEKLRILNIELLINQQVAL